MVNRHGITDELKSFIREDPSEYVAFPINHKEWLKSELDQFENRYKKEGKDYLDYGDNRLFVSPEKYQKICNYVDSWIDQKLVDDWTGKTEEREKEEREQQRLHEEERERAKTDREEKKKEKKRLDEIEYAKSKKIHYELDFLESDTFNGLHESYYDNGQVHERGKFVDGKKDGKFELFYEDGQKKEVGEYHLGEPINEGYFGAFYPSGEPWKHTIYFEGSKNYTTTEYWKNDNTKKRYSYDETFSDFLDENVDFNPFSDTELEGPNIEISEHNEEGKIQKYETYNGAGLTERKTYWPNGDLRKKESYSMGVKSGEWLEYDAEGNQIYRENWSFGVLFESFDDRGIEIETDVSDKDSLKDALEELKELYEENLISKEVYEERQRELLQKNK